MNLNIDLSENQNEKIFEKISRRYFFGKFASPSPKGIILGGQPGSGKSFLVNEIKKEFLKDSFIFVSTDDLRLYHPAYQQLQKDPETIQNAANLVNPYASAWTEKLIKLCIENHFNIIIDSTLGGNIEAVFKTIDMLRANDFLFHLRVLAVHPWISKLSIFLRYEAQLAEKGFARWTRMEDHDDRFEKLESVLIEVLTSKFPDSIKFFERFFKENVTNSLICFDSFQFKNQRDTLLKLENVFINFKHRREFLTSFECEYLINGLNQVGKMILNRNGDTTIFKEFVLIISAWVSGYEDYLKLFSPTLKKWIPVSE